MIQYLTRAPREALARVLPQVFVLAFSSAMAGCATQYGELGITGGYVDKMYSEDTGVLVVAGNGFTSEGKVAEMVMLRASEMTLQNNRQRFSLINAPDQAALDAEKAGRLPVHLRERAARQKAELKMINEHTTTYSRHFTHNTKKSTGAFYIVMYRGNEGGQFDAGKLEAELRPKLQPKTDKQTASSEAKPATE
jgi:hypothetical protein